MKPSLMIFSHVFSLECTVEEWSLGTFTSLDGLVIIRGNLKEEVK